MKSILFGLTDLLSPLQSGLTMKSARARRQSPTSENALIRLDLNLQAYGLFTLARVRKILSPRYLGIKYVIEFHELIDVMVVTCFLLSHSIVSSGLY